MNELFVRFQKSDFGSPDDPLKGASDFCALEQLRRLGTLGRLGIDKEEFVKAERETRIELLGIADLQNQEKKPPHRPPSVDAALKRDRIIEAVYFELVRHPLKWPMKNIIGDVGIAYGVNKSTIYDCFKIDRERKKTIKASVTHLVFGPSMLALALHSCGAAHATAIDLTGILFDLTGIHFC